MKLRKAFTCDEGHSGVVFGSMMHGALALMTVCPDVESRAWVNDRAGRDTVQFALVSSRDSVPLKITLKRLAESDVKIRANVASIEGDEPVWLNKWNMVEKGRDTIITSNQFTDRQLYVDRKKAVPKMTVAESKESSEPGLSLKIVFDTDTPGDEVNWSLAIPLPAGGVGPGWPEPTPHERPEHPLHAAGWVASSIRGWHGNPVYKSVRAPPEGVVSKGVRAPPEGVVYKSVRAPPTISKATLETRGKAESVSTRHVSFTSHTSVKLSFEIMFHDGA